MITPVKVTLETGDSTYVRVVDDRARDIHRNKVTINQQQRWKISAAALPPVPYTPKSQMGYWK